MSGEQRSSDKPVAHAVAALLRNRFMVALLFVFLTIELFNGVVISTWRNAIGVQIDMQNLAKIKAETCLARASAAGKLSGDTAVQRIEFPEPELGDCGIGYDKYVAQLVHRDLAGFRRDIPKLFPKDSPEEDELNAQKMCADKYPRSICQKDTP